MEEELAYRQTVFRRSHLRDGKDRSVTLRTGLLALFVALLGTGCAASGERVQSTHDIWRDACNNGGQGTYACRVAFENYAGG